MAILSANMSTCNKKERCLNGVNKGLAYDPLDPCPSTLIGGFPQTFNPTTCDCEQQDRTKRTRMIFVSGVGLNGDWSAGQTVITSPNAYFDNAGNLVTYALSLVPFFGVDQPETNAYFGRCNGSDLGDAGKCFWATFASLTSVSECYCFSCSGYVVFPTVTKFVNNQYTSFDSYYSFYSATGKSICNNSHPAFYSVNVRYEIEDEPNVWTTYAP
jgi:hypothetical protein